MTSAVNINMYVQRSIFFPLRYYVDPSTIIHTPPVDKSGGAAAGSNGSVGGIPVQQHSTTSGGASSNLIGATLTARVQQQQQQRSNISISRPHQQQQHQPPTTQNGKVGNRWETSFFASPFVSISLLLLNRFEKYHLEPTSVIPWNSKPVF